MFHHYTQKYFQQVLLDSQFPASHNGLELKELLDIPVVEPVVADVDVWLGVVLSVVCKKLKFVRVHGIH